MSHRLSIFYPLKQCLYHVKLIQNQIGDQGAQYLAEALKQNTVISSRLNVSQIF